MEEIINAKKILDDFFNFISHNYPKIEPAGILYSRQAYGKFNPSAGHHIIDPILREKKPQEIKTFSISERCLREADSSRIGLSNRHLSFFEMFAYLGYGKNSELPFEKNTESFYKLLTDILGLNKNKILITILKECKIDNIHITEKENEKIYNEWSKFLPKEQIKKTKGRRNLFLAKIPNAAGGTGVEIYYKMSDGKYIEIGSQVYYHYIYHGKNNINKTINGNLGSGLGFERILMALENKANIFDISLIKPLKDRIIIELGDGTEQFYEDSIHSMIDNIRAISFIIYDKEKQNKKLTQSQNRILNKFRKNLDSLINYLGLNDKICKDLIEIHIGLYKDRYPDLPQYKSKILNFINGEI